MKDEDRQDLWSGRKTAAKRYRPEEIFGIFDNEVAEQVKEYATDGWNRVPEEGSYYVQATFVTENAGHQHRDFAQFLPLLEHMLANGWHKVHEWKNPNSENTIVLIGKQVEFVRDPDAAEENDDE